MICLSGQKDCYNNTNHTYIVLLKYVGLFWNFAIEHNLKFSRRSIMNIMKRKYKWGFSGGLCTSVFSFLCSVDYCLSFRYFVQAIGLSVLLRFTTCDYSFGIIQPSLNWWSTIPLCTPCSENDRHTLYLVEKSDIWGFIILVWIGVHSFSAKSISARYNRTKVNCFDRTA